ncbi:MAG: hypothetical protein KGI51_09940 [Rhodospirillales bacterium]|nr:hypothetical protein [Rhodospirillales bacterium]
MHDVPLGPEDLPAISAFDLDRAWQAARGAALAEAWSPARFFRFRRPDGRVTELLLADPDAGCWAGAVDRIAGLASVQGVSLCLRLLALVDLLARVPAIAALCRFARDGAELDPALLRLAATVPLLPEGGFDAARFRAALAVPSAPIPSLPEPAR